MEDLSIQGFFGQVDHMLMMSKQDDMGGTEHCYLENQKECMGEIHSCQNPEPLRNYLIGQGLGWEKKKG